MAKVIAVTGKGGTGKTVVSALMTKYLKERASGPVLAIDADPDANLGTVLGIPVEKTIGDLREDTLRQIKNLPAGISKTSYIEAGLHGVIVECPKIDLVTMGRPEGPGCYCYINSIVRKFAEDLHSSYQWVVMDNEAGLEHLSRRIATRVDYLITVVNENPLSIDCARRIAEIVADLKSQVTKKYFVANNVAEDRVETVQNKMSGLGMEYLGFMPHDNELESQIFAGKSLFDLGNTAAGARMEEIMKKMGE